MLQSQLDKLTTEHATLKVHTKSINDEYIRQKADLKTLTISLQMSNDVRQSAEDNLVELQKQHRTVKDAFKDRDEHLQMYKRRYEEE